MLNLAKLQTKPKIFHRLTGLTPEQFTDLLAQVETLYLAHIAELKAKRPNRQRASGAGTPLKLDPEHVLFGLLVYYRSYSSHVFIGMLLGIDDSNVGRYFHKLEPQLAKVFRIPERRMVMSQDEIMELIVDATEQPSDRRPGSGYSGKKKRQTLKNQLHIERGGKIVGVSRSIAGNIHDKELYDMTRAYAANTDVPPDKLANLGYLGTSCILPKRKPRDKPRPVEDGVYNQLHSQRRIPVEHTIGAMKKFRILDQRFRNKPSSHSLIFKNIAGLRNLQLGF